MTRPTTNFRTESYINFIDRKYHFASLDNEDIYNPENWKWVDEFNHYDCEQGQYYIRFGFVYIGKPRRDYLLSYTMANNFKLANDKDMLDRRKNILVHKFIDILYNRSLETSVDITNAKILDEYIKKPYSVGGNL